VWSFQLPLEKDAHKGLKAYGILLVLWFGMRRSFL